jgi:hypothetical protein
MFRGLVKGEMKLRQRTCAGFLAPKPSIILAPGVRPWP